MKLPPIDEEKVTKLIRKNPGINGKIKGVEKIVFRRIFIRER